MPITKEEVEKFIKSLEKDGKITPEEGKKLVREVIADTQKKIKESEIKEKIPIRHSAVKSIASMNLFNRVSSSKALKDILMQKKMNSLLLSQLLRI